MKNNFDKEKLERALIGIEFEFYSNLSLEKTAESLSKKLNKRIVIPYSLNDIQNPKPLYHSPITPTEDIFKIEPDYSGGPDMREMITGPLKYKEAKDIIIKVFEWIRDNGYTNERCSIHINMSLPEEKTTIDKINILYFILTFDEDKVYERFPNRKDSVYARSIKKIYPNNIIYYSTFNGLSKEKFVVPSEKYFGVNFTKAEKGYLEYRYLGGLNYHKKRKEILELIDYFIEHLYKVSNWNGVLSRVEETKWEKYVEKYEKVVDSIKNYENFTENYPEIKLTIDLQKNEQIIKTYWHLLEKFIYKLLTSFGMKSGKINYDSDKGQIEVKDATLSGGSLNYYHFYDCELEGVFDNCYFTNCTIKNSRISNSNMVRNNEIISSKIAETALTNKNKFVENCFIENKKEIIDCEVIKGVIRYGIIGKKAKISKETLIIEEIKQT